MTLPKDGSTVGTTPDGEAPSGPVVRDRRRLDPETGQVRTGAGTATDGDLESGPFAAIADKLESVLARFGLSRFGEPGETFDPTVHEALMHTEAELAEGTTDTTVVQVLQPGYRQSTGSGDKVLRAARVAVADPR